MFRNMSKEKLFWSHARAVRNGLWNEARNAYAEIGRRSSKGIQPIRYWNYKVCGSASGKSRLVFAPRTVNA